MKNDLTELRGRINSMWRSATRVALIEQAILLADSMNDIRAGYDLRTQLASDATFEGFPEKVLVAYSWNLAQSDRDPEKFPESNLLWNYKWAISSLWQFPQITRQQLDDSLADLTRRYQRNGGSMRPVYNLRCDIATLLGDRQAVLDNFPLWRKAPRDHLTDCEACDRAGMVSTYRWLGQYRRSLQVAKPILDRTMWCHTVPHTTYGNVLTTLLRVGRVQDAAEFHAIGYPMVRNQLNYIDTVGDHLTYLVLVRELSLALKVFETHFRLALAATSPLDRFNFYLSALLLFVVLQTTSSKVRKRKLRLPETFPLWNEQGSYEYAQLADWLQTEATALADQFDQRAGNRDFQDELDGLVEFDAEFETARKSA